MSSWLVSLGCVGGRFGRRLQEYGLGSSRVPHDIRCAGPWRLLAEARAQMVEQRRDLVVAHGVGEAGHDRAAFTCRGPDAGEYDVGGVARVGAAEGAAQREIDPAIGRTPVA